MLVFDKKVDNNCWNIKNNLDNTHILNILFININITAIIIHYKSSFIKNILKVDF
jgi:hypothetical protein